MAAWSLFARILLALLVSTALMLVAAVDPQPVAADGELEGDIPAGGGLAGVLWGGGSVDELAVVAASRGCGVRSAWTFEGVARGYVTGAPGFVNARFLARFPAAMLPPGTILVLVCEATGVGPPPGAGPPTLADVVAPYSPEALVLRGAAEFEASIGAPLRADDDLRTNGSGLLNFLSPADELCTLLTNSRLVLRASGSHALLAGGRYCDSSGVGSGVMTAFGGAIPFGTTWLAELWPGVTGALSEPGLLVRVYSGAVQVTGAAGGMLLVPAGAQVVVDDAGVIGGIETFEPGPLERQLLAGRGTLAEDRRIQASGTGVRPIDDETAMLSFSARDALRTITLRNIGDRSLQITSIASGDENQFVVRGTGDCASRVLVPGGECNVMIEAVGCYEGSGWLGDIIVRHDGSPSPYTIAASKPGRIC